jgi:hypothetical protein
MEEIDRTVPRSRDLEMAEESSNPREQNPKHDQNQERGPNRVHDCFEMALVFCSFDKRGCPTYE